MSTKKKRKSVPAEKTSSSKERNDFMQLLPEAIKSNMNDFSATVFTIRVYLDMNYSDSEMLEDIRERLSNPNIEGDIWRHNMTINFRPLFFRRSHRRIVSLDSINNLFNRQVENVTKLNAAYDDTPVDPLTDDEEIPNPFDLVLFSPDDIRQIEQEPVDTTVGDEYELQYWYRVNMGEVGDNIQPWWALSDISEIYDADELQELRSGFDYRMAQLAARACRLMLPPMETETNYSVFKVTNNNCFSSRWWEQQIETAVDGYLRVDIEVQHNYAIDLRTDEKNIVNLKF